LTDTGEDARRLALRQTLRQSVGTDPGAAALASAYFGLSQQTAGQLEPVIGVGGVEALFGRALHLTARRLSWLPSAASGNSAAPMDVFQICLAGRSASEASDAGETLLLTFAGLLAGMVGESLTGRLLGAGWTAGDSQVQAQPKQSQQQQRQQRKRPRQAHPHSHPQRQA
jgi:hypothetical protein